MEVELASSSPAVGNGTPSDTPRQTSLFSTSRRSSGRITPSSSFTPSTPPALPTDNHNDKDTDQADDVPPLDPRRLTPNLHANLVSEILALRREVESKDALVDRLEGELSSSKSENESLQDDLARNSRETKAIKQQLQSIEDGTLTALEDLCKERDEANEAAAELKKRLETSHRQLKVEGEKNDRLHKEWEAEKVRWIQEKNLLQRKCDITESRLKTVIDELVAYESQNIQQPEPTQATLEKQDTTAVNDPNGSLQSSPVKVRAHHRQRSSVSTIGSVRPTSVATGTNLADELDVHEDEVQSDGEALEDTPSRFSKNLQLNEVDDHDWAEKQTFETDKDKPILEQPQSQTSSAHDRNHDLASSHITERDATVASVPKSNDDEEGKSGNVVNDAISISSPAAAVATMSESSDTAVGSNEDFAAHAQTVESASISSQPSAEAGGLQEIPPLSKREIPEPSVSTDTPSSAEPPILLDPQNVTSSPLPIPEIAVHAPQSRPSSPKDTVTPAGTESVGVQTDVTLFLNSRSVAVQTDVIRVDRRAYNLPSHLLSTSIKPQSHMLSTELAADKTGPTRNDISGSAPIPPVTGTEQEIQNEAPAASHSTQPEGEIDDPTWARLRRNLMFGSKYSKSPDNDPFKTTEDQLSTEPDYVAPPTTTNSTARPIRRPQKLGKAFDPPTPVPENEKVNLARPNQHRPQASGSSRNSLDRSNPGARPASLATSSKGKHIRQSSERSGTPTSLASSSAWSKNTNLPPGIVVPKRTSSIGAKSRRRDGNSSPPFRSGSSSPTKGRDNKRVGKKPVLRKARSASLAPSEYRSDGQRSFPVSPYSQTSFASGETSPPPVPENAILQVYRDAHQRTSSSQTRRLSAVYPTGNASVGSSIQHSVVDAIAATMVGEWMWKYVRKRKTFGTSESAQESARTSDQRHKRWVWLSPYERTLMWSSKQPSTNSALMGKAGRTVTIQSVLDVKDENLQDQSNSSQPAFNRSILVLTPSRAIKFTASSRERHYLWLTALSFLAHHTAQGSLDLSFIPPNGFPGSPTEETVPDLSRTTSATASRSGRKPWSSRTTNLSQQSSGYGTPSIPEATASAEGEITTIPPKPSRPAPQAPSSGTPDNIPSESAMAPTVPRIPGGAFPSSSKNIFGIPKKHARNRSASSGAVMSINRPSPRVNQTGPSSSRSYPNTGGTNSTNHSTRSGINIPNGRRSNAPPTLPVINITGSNGTAAPVTTAATIAKYLGTSVPSQTPPHPPSSNSGVDQTVLVESHRSFPIGDSAPTAETTYHVNLPNGNSMAVGEDGEITGTDFGGNSRFFDAVGTSLGGAPGADTGAIPPPPKRAAPPPPPSSAAPSAGFRHVSGDSFDSVAPPPIRGARPFAQRYDGDFPYDTSYSQYGTGDANHMPMAHTESHTKEAEKSKSARPPSRKRGFFGLGKS